MLPSSENNFVPTGWKVGDWWSKSLFFSLCRTSNPLKSGINPLAANPRVNYSSTLSSHLDAFWFVEGKEKMNQWNKNVCELSDWNLIPLPFQNSINIRCLASWKIPFCSFNKARMRPFPLLKFQHIVKEFHQILYQSIAIELIYISLIGNETIGWTV